MPVYVDDMRARVGRMIMCHMVADTEAELHAMARDIGLAPEWCQEDHYDICLTRRRWAIASGAIPVPMRTLAIMVANRRATGTLGTPDTAIAVWQQRRAQRTP